MKIKDKFQQWLYDAKKKFLGVDFEKFFEDEESEPVDKREIIFISILFIIPIVCMIISVIITHKAIDSMNVNWHELFLKLISKFN